MLDGITVLSVSQYLAGPLATRLLGDLGARVIKVENVDGGDPYRYMNMPYDRDTPDDLTYRFALYNRGKRSIALDLSDERGQEVFRSLAGEADVLVENHRSGRMDRFGLGYDELSRVNPDIVYTSLTGYGETGPFRDRPAMDGLIQGASGLAHHNATFAGEPVFSGLFAADIIGGTYAAMSSLSGVVSMLKGEGGTHVDVSLMDAIVSLYGHEAAEFSATGTVSSAPTISTVPYGMYETADGRLALIVTDPAWSRFCDALGFDDWIESGEFDDPAVRQDNEAAIEDRVRTRLRSEPTGYWEELLLEADVLVSPVNSVNEALTHEQIEHRGTVRRTTHEGLGEIVAPVFPGLFSTFDVDASSPAPRFGEHTTEVLRDAGYAEREIDALRGDEVVSARD